MHHFHSFFAQKFSATHGRGKCFAPCVETFQNASAYSHASTATGRASALLNFGDNFGIPSIYAYTLWRTTTKFDLITYIWRWLVVRGQRRSRPKRRVPALPILGVPFYLCVVRTPFVAELSNSRGNAYGEGACFGGQPRQHPKGVGSQHSPIWGSFLFMHTPFVAELPNLTW